MRDRAFGEDRDRGIAREAQVEKARREPPHGIEHLGVGDAVPAVAGAFGQKDLVGALARPANQQGAHARGIRLQFLVAPKEQRAIGARIELNRRVPEER